MASLQVRDLPDNIYHSLQKQAKEEHRSPAQEAVVVMPKGLDLSISDKKRRSLLLEDIESNDVNFSVKQMDPIDLLREGRIR
jgi:plasmid stability protein